MSEFPTELVIRQTLRSAVFDSTNMGIMSSKAEHFQSRNNTTTSNTKTLVETTFWNILRSPETLKLIYDKPNEYITKIYENDSFQDTLKEARDDNESKIMKNRILYAFLKDIRDSRPPPAMEWIAFQHYMYFLYRHFISVKPITTNETLPNILVKKMYELVLSLTHEDKTQFYVRIVTLLREYVMTARGHFESIKTNSDITVYLTCLLSYYDAFCLAANKLSVVLAEFDQFINNRFHINWYCLNQRMFFQYFFKSPSVQSKVQIFNELIKEEKEPLKKQLESYNSFINDMIVLDRHWEVQRRRITLLSAHYLTVEIHTCSEKNDSEECQWLQKDWKMFNEITRIMKTNYWIIRTEDAKAIQDMNELDGHILALVGDTWYIADRLITSCGYCICEDCLSAEFKAILSNSFTSIRRQSTASMSRLMTCYLCQDIISLESLANHIITKHADLNIPKADLTKTYKWHMSTPIKKNTAMKRPSTQFCKALTEAMELVKHKDSQIFKVCTDHVLKMNNDLETKSKENLSKTLFQNHIQINNNPSDVNNESTGLCIGDNNDSHEAMAAESSIPTNSFKINIEPIMKIASEAPKMIDSNDIEESRLDFGKIVNSQTLFESPTKCKPVINGIIDNEDKQDSLNNINSDDKAWSSNNVKSMKTQVSLKVTENRKLIENPNQQQAKPSVTPQQTNCAGHICGHKCKEEGKHTCDHKEVKRCDCAYCEVFGASVPSHTVKTNETRDRLRTRLNQRKQTKVEKLSVQKAEVTIPNDNKNNVQSPKYKPKITNNKPLLPSNVTTNPKPCLHTVNNSPSNCPCIGQRPDSDILEKVDNKLINSLNVRKPNTNDINELLNFIEGHKNIDKLALAEKKAAKKARQKLKKEQEKQRKEEEELAKKREEKLQEERRKEEERLRAQALAKSQAEQQRKGKKDQYAKDLSKSSKKKKKGKQNENDVNHNDDAIQLMEETIPAMVTIKRIVENNNSPPTVTITLKGSTPDQDKLLYTLVTGQANSISSSIDTSYKNHKQKETIKNTSNAKKTKDKKKPKQNQETPTAQQDKSVTTSKELKVTLSVDKSFRKGGPIQCESKKSSDKLESSNLQNKKAKQKDCISTKVKENDLDIPSLRLPPGITITKVNGPIVNKTCKNNGSVTTAHPYQSVPVNKSGVIVVETEKLIQQSMTNNVSSKKSKKKKAKSSVNNTQQVIIDNDTVIKKDVKSPKMVTLKNPIFNNLRSRLIDKTNGSILACTNEQASITKGENGMVTIRRPKCIKIPIENENPMSEFLNELKPVVHSDISTRYNQNPVTFSYNDDKTSEIHTIISQNDKEKSLNAHDILWGLPGIEITKVNKSNCIDNDVKKTNQTADVSIIPTGGTDKFNFDRDDWPFESVFTPKDISEEDLDAEERELEAFKRFCQQSVPPKHKEKVAHLNVKDIVLKKKNDVTYS